MEGLMTLLHAKLETQCVNKKYVFELYFSEVLRMKNYKDHYEKDFLTILISRYLVTYQQLSTYLAHYN